MGVCYTFEDATETESASDIGEDSESEVQQLKRGATGAIKPPGVRSALTAGMRNIRMLPANLPQGEEVGVLDRDNSF